MFTRLLDWINTLRGINRVRTPTYLQMEAVECGAAALGSVLAYFGKHVPLEELRVACGVSRNGSTAENLYRAAEQYGLKTKAFIKRDLEELKETTLPAIIFWRFYHFVVLEGLDGEGYFINDPESGPRKVTAKDFDESFTGILLTFEPDESFRKKKKENSFYTALKKRLKGFEGALSYVLLAAFLLVLPGLAIPILSKIFVDEILVEQSGSWLVPVLAGLTGAMLLKGLLDWLQRFYLLKLETGMSLVTSSNFFRHILHLPMTFFSQRSPGEIGYRVGLNDNIARLLSGELAKTFFSLLTIIFYAALMFYYDVLLTLITIAFALLSIAALRYISRKRIDANEKLTQERGALFGKALTGLHMIETIKATASENEFFGKWAGNQAKYLNTQQKLAVLTETLMAAPVMLTMVNSLIILTLGAMRIIDGEITAGTLVAFQTLAASFSSPVTSLINLGSQLQNAEAEMKRIDDVYNYPADEKLLREINDTAVEKTVKLDGFLELKNITFGYSRLEEPLLKDFSLKLHPGERVALVGRSGCGKSTVAKLIAGLYEPWSGDILFDKSPRSEFTRSTLTNSVAFVDQDIFIFEGSVADNLCMWDETIAQSAVSRAAKDAMIHEDITERHGAYDSIVSESGVNFSGGQRQRLEIARALVTDPSILVLDEATSALDPKTEEEVDLNIRRRGCTTLIVAHRLSTIRDADEIIVMDEGKIMERGTHEELMERNGYYTRLMQE